MRLGELFELKLQSSPLNHRGRVEIQLADQEPSRTSLASDNSVLTDPDRRVVQFEEWIGHRLIRLNAVASSTRIDKVLVVQSPLRRTRHRRDVINLKSSNDFRPRFSLKTVDAAEVELVPKPRTIPFVF